MMMSFKCSNCSNSNFILLIVPMRYFCCGSYCFMSWCLIFVLFAPYVRFHAPNFEENEGSHWFGSVRRVSPVSLLRLALGKEPLELGS